MAAINSCSGTLSTLCFTQGPCDDGDPCTINDQYQLDCSCEGVYIDADSDGICDGNDICPGMDDTIDTDNDGIPDDCDDCLDQVVHTANQIVSSNVAAVQSIHSNHIIPSNGNITFNAGQEVELSVDFEVKVGAVFHAYIETCAQ